MEASPTHCSLRSKETTVKVNCDMNFRSTWFPTEQDRLHELYQIKFFYAVTKIDFNFLPFKLCLFTLFSRVELKPELSMNSRRAKYDLGFRVSSLGYQCTLCYNTWTRVSVKRSWITLGWLQVYSGKLGVIVVDLLELVSKELNHLAAILHVYAGVWFLWSKKKRLLFFKKKREILLHF